MGVPFGERGTPVFVMGGIMSEHERRQGYAYNRVLIETAHVLVPEFADAVVWLSGAQLQMLRNITQYLNRQETYVDDYMPGYYVTPDADDYDSILEIVADLEETLMGNPNTIWGYADQYYDPTNVQSTGAGSTILETDPIPSGYVAVVYHWVAWHLGGTTVGIKVNAIVDATTIPLYDEAAIPHQEYVTQITNVVLKEGDYMTVKFTGLPDTEWGYLRMLGYSMIVPE